MNMEKEEKSLKNNLKKERHLIDMPIRRYTRKTNTWYKWAEIQTDKDVYDKVLQSETQPERKTIQHIIA